MAYSEKDIDRIFNYICLEISENSLSLNSALKLDNTPSFTTFYKWIDSDKKKMEKYARSCSKRFDNIFEDILRIADDQEGDTYKNEDGIDLIGFGESSIFKIAKKYRYELLLRSSNTQKLLTVLHKIDTPTASIDMDSLY